jgi:hypothetical protein
MTILNRTLKFESLENRRMMAGNVQVYFHGNDLCIVGDSAANGVEVRQASPGVYKVDGFVWGGDFTKVNGMSNGEVTAKGVAHDVVIALQGGGDDLEFGIGDQNKITVPNNLLISTGNGNETINIRDVAVGAELGIATGSGQDNVYIQGCTVGTNLVVGDAVGKVNSNASDNITILSTSVKNELAISTGLGNDSVNIDSCAANSIYAELGAGNDSFHMTNTKAPRSGFVVDGGSGYDTFNVPDYNNTRFNGSNFEVVKR